MNSIAHRLVVLIAVLLLASMGMLHGQIAVTGAVTGSVSDPSSAAIPDAAVDIANTATGVTDATTTNSAGVYRFTSLIPGTYSLTVKKANFSVVTRQDIRVDAGSSVHIDLTMPVGAVTTTVDVTGQTPILQTDSPEVSEDIQAKEINALPTFGRNITRLSLLAPGAMMESGQLDL